MLNYQSTGDDLRVTTSASGDLDYVISYTKHNTHQKEYLSEKGTITTATTTVLLGNNTDANPRFYVSVEEMIFKNNSATTQTLVFDVYNGTNDYKITPTFTLLQNEVLIYRNGEWNTLDATGLKKNSNAKVVSSNSTTTPLNTGTSFTGSWIDVSGFPDLSVAVTTDQDGYITVEYSPDGTNTDSTLTKYYRTSFINPPYVFENCRQYARVKFTNDSGSNQTYIRLQTILGERGLLNSGMDGTLSPNYNAVVVRPTNAQDEVHRGLRQGVTTWHKFAYRDTGLTAAGGEQTLWADNSNFTVMTSSGTFDIAYNAATDGAGGGATGATTLLIDYIDGNYELQQATHVLGSSSPDTTSFSGLGINRVVVVASGSSTYNVNAITITDTAATAGTQAYIPATLSVTQQMVFHFPISHIGVANWMFLGCNKLSGSNPKVTFKVYVYNRLVATRYEVFRHTIDTQSDTSLELNDPRGFRFSGRDVMYMVVDTDQNNTVVDARMSFDVYKNVDA